ncbi:DUF2066 domain-containing protein [Shewanella surugensis]|uniref:DUF2066 domain-containing protein n=1 Tax=Shewanella surugensis TaxID=212020 RepID=A0ABT0LFR4_9GAMM|nr:DUF2066 domain-containing protein [Shewanella surugensis]MCL1126399.1 DUF2066 domain-containing protein [Shewanella surugensis]
MQTILAPKNLAQKFIAQLPLLVLSTLIMFSATLSAAEVTQLDESLVSVDNRSTAQRNAGIKKAFDNVILKNSGLQSALKNPLVAAKHKNPNALMTQYGYQEKEGQLYLKVNFDNRSIVNLLRQANLPVWGKQRPLTLIWLVSDNENGQRQITSDESDTPMKEDFSRQASNRGMPFIFPLMDLDDSMRISVTDVRGMFVDNVAGASSRYQADFFIMASIENSGSGVEYALSLYAKTRNAASTAPLLSMNSDANNVNTAISAMMAKVSEYYVDQYAIVDSGDQLSAKVTFSGISNMQQMVALEKYIGQLRAIKSSQLVEMKDDSVTYDFALFSTQADLFRVMDLEPRLKPLSKSAEPVMSTMGSYSSGANGSEAYSSSPYSPKTIGRGTYIQGQGGTPSAGKTPTKIPVIATIYQWKGH